ELHAALEGESEVLAVRVHRLEHSAVDLFGASFRLRPGVRRLGRDALADEHLETACRAMERVAFGHVSYRSPTGQTEIRTLPRHRAAGERLFSTNGSRPERDAGRTLGVCTGHRRST